MFISRPQYLQLVLGLSPLQAGLWTLPWALSFVVGSMVTPRLVRRFRPASLMTAGLVLAAVGFAVFTQLDAASGFGDIVFGSVLFSLGTAPLFTLTNDLIIGSAPPERAGAAAGISETAAEFGGALGIAVFGSVGVAMYRGAIADRLPAGVPLEAADAARDTLGGAIEVAGELPSRLGPELVDVASEAFIGGLHVAAAISAVGSIGLAILVAALLRRAGGGSEADSQPKPSQEGAGDWDAERVRGGLVVDSVGEVPDSLPSPDGGAGRDEVERVRD